MGLNGINEYEVTFTDQTKIRCLGCDRRLSRQRTFRAPLPSNVSRWDVRAELREKAMLWRLKLRGVCAECMRSGEYVMLEDGNFALKFFDSARLAA